MRITMVGALALFGLGGDAYRVAAAVLNVEAFALANGMKVVLVPDHRVPVVTHVVFYGVGSADEEPGKSGLAHFFEHLMFKGTQANPGDAYARAIGRVGGDLNAFTSYDYTAYYATVANESLDRVMALEADRMTNLDLSEDHVRVERDVIIEERRLRVDNNPEALLQEQAMATLFVNHRYGVPVIGWMHEIQAWTRDDALAFYRRWYAPNNAILVVAGDVERDRLRLLAERYYGPLKPVPIMRKRTVEPDLIAERRVIMADPRIGRRLWMRLFLAPAYGTPDRSRTVAVQVLAELLGGGPASVLHRRLVRELSVAAEIGVEYAPEAVDPTPFAVIAVPATGISLSSLERAIAAEIETLRRGAIEEADVRRARQTLRAAEFRARDSTHGEALVIGMALAAGATLDEIEALPERISAITADEVRSEARTLLRVDASATGLLILQRE